MLGMKSKAAEALLLELKGTSIFHLGLKSTIKTKHGNTLADTLRYTSTLTILLIKLPVVKQLPNLSERDMSKDAH